IIEESLDLNLQKIPGIRHVSNCSEALQLARSQPRFNLIVTNLAVGEMDAAQLAASIKSAGLEVPVVVLAYDYREVKNFVARYPMSGVDRIFLWQGNARIPITILKYNHEQWDVLPHTPATGRPE